MQGSVKVRNMRHAAYKPDKKVWEFVLKQIVTCTHPRDMPHLEERWERVNMSELLQIVNRFCLN